MIRFLDGPAAGCKGLCLARAPLYLRAVQSPAGKWDALDLLTDEPGPEERIWAYRRVGQVGSVHVDFARGKGRSASGWYVLASYQLVEPQPGDAVLRDTSDWRLWCVAQQEREKEAARG